MLFCFRRFRVSCPSYKSLLVVLLRVDYCMQLRCLRVCLSSCLYVWGVVSLCLYPLYFWCMVCSCARQFLMPITPIRNLETHREETLGRLEANHHAHLNQNKVFYMKRGQGPFGSLGNHPSTPGLERAKELGMASPDLPHLGSSSFTQLKNKTTARSKGKEEEQQGQSTYNLDLELAETSVPIMQMKDVRSKGRSCLYSRSNDSALQVMSTYIVRMHRRHPSAWTSIYHIYICMYNVLFRYTWAELPKQLYTYAPSVRAESRMVWFFLRLGVH